jgi:TonB family protein
LGTSPVVTPPRINAEEKPKLAFENPGASTGTAGQRGTIPSPKPGVDEAMRQVARGGTGGRMVLGDETDSVAGPTPGLRSPLPGRLGSSMELLSDPMGIDLRPYLLRVLSAVRRNWFAVIPESANLGQTGRVVVQFAISKDGSVPKVVFATPSGREALDRAAVAGISASNPFPPLPPEFRGSQIRVQLVFRYNLAQ